MFLIEHVIFFGNDSLKIPDKRDHKMHYSFFQKALNRNLLTMYTVL